ncbi:MAG: hypothetical protein PHG66_06490 [Candidatus Colwellbacteria bacterium]|nr:hypothetical protein [Candidatus Colwellbacteria bacterium]
MSSSPRSSKKKLKHYFFTFEVESPGIKLYAIATLRAAIKKKLDKAISNGELDNVELSANFEAPYDEHCTFVKYKLISPEDAKMIKSFMGNENKNIVMYLIDHIESMDDD